MAVTIDHLCADHRFRVLRDFRDLRGKKHRAEETAVIRHIGMDWTRQEIEIEWERDGAKDTLVFSSNAKEGPRSGFMREYFAIEERVPRYEDTLTGRAEKKRAELMRSVPAVQETPVTQAERYDDAIARVWALAAQKRFGEAEQQIHLIFEVPTDDRGRLERVAESMEELAAAYAVEHGEVYDWLRDRAISLWYSWGSQATSGGEGAAMSVRIREAERRLPERKG